MASVVDVTSVTLLSIGTIATLPRPSTVDKFISSGPSGEDELNSRVNVSICTACRARE